MSDQVVDLRTASREWTDCVLAIGTFDGVHLAHRALVERARTRAGELGTRVLAVTFEPHPKEILLERPPPRLTGRSEKARRLRHAGVDAVCVLEFDEELQELEPCTFVERVLVEALGARACCVGYNFSFGREGRGRPEDLRRLAEERGLEVQVMPALDIDGIPVSSTSIRVLLSCGHVATAARRMVEPHTLTGVVVPGDGRGRGLGYATANLTLEPPNLLVPRPGVYAGEARREGGACSPALVNIGEVPTFRKLRRARNFLHLSGREGIEHGRELRIEVHLLDHDGSDLYDERLAVRLNRRVREERRFGSSAELVEQLSRDVAKLRRSLEHDREEKP